MSPLHWAADRGLVPFVLEILKHGANINAQDNDGQTPLHYAASCGHIEVARILLAEGADKSILDFEGNSSFDLASPSFLSEFT